MQFFLIPQYVSQKYKISQYRETLVWMCGPHSEQHLILDVCSRERVMLLGHLEYYTTVCGEFLMNHCSL